MRRDNTHIIRRQYLRVTVNGTEKEGLALQNRLSRFCNDRLLPALEQVLDRCAPAGGHLYVERLEVDAGVFDSGNWEQDLPSAVAEAVEKALRERILPGESSPQATAAGSAQHQTEQQTLLQAFLYFLKTGRLPWSFRTGSGKTLEQMLLDGAGQGIIRVDIFPPGAANSVLQTLTLSTARKRLVRQFSAIFAEALMEWLSPEVHASASRILQTLRRSKAQQADIKVFEKHLLEKAFEQIAAGSIADESKLVAETVQALSAARLLQSAKTLPETLKRHWPGAMPGVPAVDPKSKTRPKIAGQVVKPPGTAREEAALNQTRSPEPPEPEMREGIYLDNAGLVLLHPFLPRFFDGLHIAAEDRLLQPDRALCLLHFLATGKTAAPEYELALPKILCNVPSDAPVEAEIDLTGNELEEAAALLEAVIRHWEALRSTTPDGLRGTFLLRPGKLSLRDDGDWLLQVESKTYDVLLDHLPWSIGMIKLPWMERMLWVEWE